MQSTAQYYNQLASSHGDSIQSVGWYSTETQELRFLMLSMVGDLQEATVLDVGCGKGDLYHFLDQIGTRVTYEGIDLSAELVALAKKAYPQANIKEADFLQLEPSPRADYVLCSGAMSLKHPDQTTYYQNFIKKMFDSAEEAVAFNMLSSFAPEAVKESRFHYYDPVEVLTYCLTLTSFVELKQSYLPNDFTIYLYKH